MSWHRDIRCDRIVFMRVYISGITGTGMGPLALMAKAAGLEVSGSDLDQGAIYDELIKAGIEVYIGEQDGKYLQEKLEKQIDWFVYTSALPEDHAELVIARRAGIKCTKRDDFTAFLVDKLRLKMVAVAGTHGKTTTTAMIIWTALKLGLPVSYIVGTTLGFASSGAYHEGDKYFIYEADEYDRNFLKFHPWLAVITSVSYDHPDIYKTPEEYRKAFSQFEDQSKKVIRNAGVFEDAKFELAGEVRRYDAALAGEAVLNISMDMAEEAGELVSYKTKPIVEALNQFPGVGRRFEKLSDGIYTDYAHHPEEIKATMDVALDEAELKGKKGVVVVYQPHQNTRQHEVQDLYYDAFIGAEKVFWLPTYLTREDESLPILKPMDFINQLNNAEVAEEAELDEQLWHEILRYKNYGYLVVLMTAGPADEWLRKKLYNI